MASTIDITKPVQGQATTLSIRDNFTAAKAEIEALQAQAGAFAMPTVGGTADAITLTNQTPITSYAGAVGSRNIFTAAFTNLTNAPTINVDGLGALPLYMGATLLPAGDIIAGNHYWCFLESATAIRVAPFDSVSSEGDTINGNLLIVGHAFDSKSISAVNNAAGVTYTGAEFTNGIILRTGAAAAYSDTTPTAAEIIAAAGRVAIGSGFDLEIINSTTRNMTMLAGPGVTLALTTGIANNQNRSYFINVTGLAPAAVTVTGIRTSLP